MISQVELSVIIPVYNGEDFIEGTVESVLTHSNGFGVECIVIDDGSSDRTPGILSKYQDKIRLYSQPNSGESAAVNVGLQLAHGRYVLIVSADDPVFSSLLFEGVTTFFEENPDVVAWYPDWRLIDECGRILKDVHLPDYDFRDLFSRNKVLPGPGTWIRKTTALEIGGRNSRWKYVGDYDFWLRLSQHGSLVHRNSVLAQWRKHARSTSISERGPKMAEERMSVIEEFIRANVGALDSREIRLARAHSFYLAARLGFFSKSVSSKKLFFQSLRTDFRVIKSIKLYEAIFMMTFPLSKYFVDFLAKLR